MSKALHNADGNNLTEPGDEGSSRRMDAAAAGATSIPASMPAAHRSKQHHYLPPVKSVQPQRMMRPGNPHRASRPGPPAHPPPSAAHAASGLGANNPPAGLQQGSDLGGYPPASGRMGSDPAGLQQASNMGGYRTVTSQLESAPAGLQSTAGLSGCPPTGQPPKPSKAKKEKSKKHRHLVDEGGDASMSSGKPASGSASEHKHKKHKHKKRHHEHGRMMVGGSASLASDLGGAAVEPGAQLPAPAAAAAAAAAAADPGVAGLMLPAPAGAASSGLPAASHAPQAQQPALMIADQVARPDSNPQPPSEAALDPLGHSQHQHRDPLGDPLGDPHGHPPKAGAGSLRAPAPIQTSASTMQQSGVSSWDAAPALGPGHGDHRSPADQAGSRTHAGNEARHDAGALTGANMQPAADDGHSAGADRLGAEMASAQGEDDMAPSPMQRDALGGNAQEREGRRSAECYTEGNVAEERPDAVRRQESEEHGAGPLGSSQYSQGRLRGVSPGIWIRKACRQRRSATRGSPSSWGDVPCESAA